VGDGTVTGTLPRGAAGFTAGAGAAARPAPRFQILGPLSIAAGRDVVVLPPAKPTILLAALLLNPNAVVAVPALQQAIWGDEQPATARAALQNCVLRLRQLFARHGLANTAVETVPGGYRVVAGAPTLDLVQFRELVRRAAAQDDPEEERHLLDEGLALWRGPLLANVPSEALHRDAVPRLAEERLRAVERVCDLKIALGAARAALPDLWSAARANPGHERLSEQLIEALYRTGRQAEALAEIRRVKGYLRTELGIDAGRSLRELEVAILQGVELGPPRAVAQPPVRLDERPADPPATPPLPVGSHFTGRAATTAAIAGQLAAGPGIVVLTGPPGIGKTALALHVAAHARRNMPGPQLLIPMTCPEGRPRPAGEIAAELGAVLAAGPEGVLVVLDDVVDAEQVRVLLDGGAHARFVITSRLSLAGTVARHGARVYRLDTFDPAESQELLVGLLGPDRAGAEPEALAVLAEACGHFPLALRAVAARLLTRPRMRIADAVGWLGEDPIGRLAVPGDPHMSVPHRMAGWLRRFEPELVTAFVRLGTSTEARFSIASGSALLGAAQATTEQVFDHLVDANLLEAGPGHYTMHDLLRRVARSAAVGTG
jgi:DNA-binding SARP family transcriptional activator